MLNFNPQWRLQAPPNDELHHGEIPFEAAEDFVQLVRTIAQVEMRKSIWECFKRRFSGPASREFWPSSTTDFAEQDGRDYILSAVANPPLFIEAFYEGWMNAQRQRPDHIPDPVEAINRILVRYRIGYHLAPPSLELIGNAPQLVTVTVPERTLEENALLTVRSSLERAATHLDRGENRAAVMESLWLLDTVSTVFSGLDLPEGRVDGIYFKTIIHDLRRLQTDGALPQVVRWMDTMYGYLSSPGGGQIRHGMNLRDDIQLNRNEARLYCNLIRSYVEYLLGEHERLTAGAPGNRVDLLN